VTVTPSTRAHGRVAARLVLAAALGFAAALLVSCGSSGKGLIPLANAGPLKIDFEEVEQTALGGGGTCSATETALAKTQRDFEELPSSVDAALRNTLRQGIANLRLRALKLCAQPLTSSSTTGTTTTRTSTQTTTETNTVPTTTTPPTETTTTTTAPITTPTTTAPGSGGGTPPSEGNQGAGGQGGGAGEGGGSAAGGVGPGQEGSK